MGTNLLEIKNRNRTLITMSAGMSMEAWNRAGIIHRELAYYKELSKHIGPLSFISYGDNYHSEVQLLKQNIPDAHIVWTRSSLFTQIPSGLFLTSFLPPLRYKSFSQIKRIRTNQISGAWTGAIIAKQLKVPFIMRAGYVLSKHIDHVSTIKQHIIKYLEKMTVKKSDAMIVTYAGAKSFFVQKYGVNYKKIWIIGNPIDTNLFSPSAPSGKKRDVLFIGRFTEQKNIPAILFACHKAKVSITLLGRGQLKKKMTELAESLKMDVQFIDFMPNEQIPQLINNHRLFMIASLFEGNPKVLLEAMSCEMPCIASNIPEHLDVIKHEKEGIIVQSTPDALANAIRNILHAPSFARKLGENARRKILKEYTLKGNALKESLLHESISQ
jgi:glycosyltransferase involved in cell wall biosynthesis